MSFDKTIDKIEQSISSLEKRIGKLEDIVLSKVPNQPQTEEPFQEINIQEKISIESFSGDSQLGWLGIIISLIGCFFFVRYSFQQNWITGAGQPIVLALLGLILFAISDTIRIKNYYKFGAILALLSLIFLFMAVYWSSIKVPITSHRFLVYASLGILFFCFFWGVIRKTSLWPKLGVTGACILPIFVIKDFIGTHWLTIYFLVVIITSFGLSLWKNWATMSGVTTLVTHLFILMFIRETNLNPQAATTNCILWMMTVFPAF
ncbi:MAG: hypothetical protein ACD_73C00514G0002, partial [uncultured bacterium]